MNKALLIPQCCDICEKQLKERINLDSSFKGDSPLCSPGSFTVVEACGGVSLLPKNPEGQEAAEGNAGTMAGSFSSFIQCRAPDPRW